MMNLVPLLLGPQNADPLAMLRTALASPKMIQTNVRSGGASGTLTVAPDGSVLAVSGSEKVIHGIDGEWEIDSEAKVYDHLPSLGPLLKGPIGTDRLTSRARALLVSVLVRHGDDGWLDRLFQRKDGAYVAEMGTSSLTLTFGKDRTLTGVRFTSLMGGEEWALSGFRTLPPNPALFRMSIPFGYSEALEPSIPDSLRQGSDLPEKFRSLAPNGAKAWLLAVLDKGTAPSERARAWLGRLTPKLPNTILESASTEDRRALVAPDSPTYILVAEGKVLGVWMGHSETEEAQMEKEISATIEEAGS